MKGLVVLEEATTLGATTTTTTTMGTQQELVGCGRPHRHNGRFGIRLVVADPEERTPLPEGRVGEIWVTSPSKAAEYYGPEWFLADGILSNLTSKSFFLLFV